MSDAFMLARSGKQHERFRSVVEYLDDHFREPLSLEQLSKVAHMSRSAFCRFFKRTTGVGFVQYLTDLRLSHARTLLRDTDDSIVTICYEVGFTNLSNFNRRFAHHCGLTPSAYRKQWKKSLQR